MNTKKEVPSITILLHGEYPLQLIQKITSNSKDLMRHYGLMDTLNIKMYMDTAHTLQIIYQIISQKNLNMSGQEDLKFIQHRGI